jgi:hypothetical protein
MRDVVTTIEEWVYEKLGAADPTLRVWPVLAPSNATYPFFTFDIGYAENTLAVGRGAPDAYAMRLELQGWVKGETRLALRPLWKIVFDALVGADGMGVKETWESAVDSARWQIECRYHQVSPVADPSAVQESDGQWRRVTHAFELHVAEL